MPTFIHNIATGEVKVDKEVFVLQTGALKRNILMRASVLGGWGMWRVAHVVA